jgi:hypothetical protein
MTTNVTTSPPTTRQRRSDAVWVTPALVLLAALLVLLAVLPWPLSAVPQHEDRTEPAAPPVGFDAAAPDTTVPSASRVFAGRDVPAPDGVPPTF